MCKPTALRFLRLTFLHLLGSSGGKLRSILFIGLIGLSAERANAQTASVVGLGASTCPEFNEETKRNPQLERDYFAWAQGFMSGILIRMPAGVDEGLNLVPKQFPLTSQAEFLRRFCQENTAKRYSDGVIALYRVLRAPPPP